MTPTPQTNERREIIAFLKSDLYEQRPDDDESLIFENPGFRVRITGSRYDPTVEAWRLSGEFFGRLDHATASEVQEWLP